MLVYTFDAFLGFPSKRQDIKFRDLSLTLKIFYPEHFVNCSNSEILWTFPELITIMTRLTRRHYFYVFSSRLKVRQRQSRKNFNSLLISLRIQLIIFIQFVSERNSTNPAIWLVPGAGVIFSFRLPQRAEFDDLIYLNELAVIVRGYKIFSMLFTYFPYIKLWNAFHFFSLKAGFV